MCLLPGDTEDLEEQVTASEHRLAFHAAPVLSAQPLRDPGL
jgi:hypothetical protein